MTRVKAGRAQNEFQLVELCAAGDTDAWDRFLRRYGGLIYSVISRYGLSYQDNRELFTHVLEKLWADGAGRLMVWKGRCRLSTYIATVVSRLCSDYLRGHYFKEGRRYDALNGHNGDGKSVSGVVTARRPADKNAYRGVLRGDCKIILEGLMTNLSTDERSILWLFYWQGMRYAEIAQILNISANDVGQKLYRARGKLRNMLANKEIKNLTDLMK